MEKLTLEELLKKDIRGKVICFPTDTVYGVGCLVDDIDSIKRIFEMKKRDGKKPLAILAKDEAQITKYIKNVTSKASSLMKKHWPGALTLIFEKTDLISDEVTCNNKTVAFRSPNSYVSQKILEKFGIMPTTSVNISGQKELNSVSAICEVFNDEIDYIVVDEQKLSEVASTIYNTLTDTVLREGSIKID